MSEIRQRKYNGKKKAAEPSEQLVKKTYNVVSIDTSSGHLGVTLANAKDGVLIEDLCDADLFYKAGLRSGDILKTVNGQAVSVHDHCLAIFDDCKGTTVNVEYVTAAELTAEFNALRKARRMRVYGCCWFMVKLILYIVIGLPVLLIVLGIPAAHVAHRLLPQKTFADHFDMAILMRLPPRWYEPLGFKKPQMGYDARPKRRVVPPSDPSKPWTIPGWDEAKEKDAVAQAAAAREIAGQQQAHCHHAPPALSPPEGHPAAGAVPTAAAAAAAAPQQRPSSAPAAPPQRPSSGVAERRAEGGGWAS